MPITSNSLIHTYDEVALARIYDNQFIEFQRMHDRGISLTDRFAPLDEITMTPQNIKSLETARAENQEILLYWDRSTSYNAYGAGIGYVVSEVRGVDGTSSASITYYTQNGIERAVVALSNLTVVTLGSEIRSYDDRPGRPSNYLIQSRRTNRPMLLRHDAGDSRGYYGRDNSVWLDSDFHNRSFRFFPIDGKRTLNAVERSGDLLVTLRSLLLENTQADTTVATGAPYVNTSTVKSPNETKTFRGHNVATMNGDTLLGFLVSLRSYAALVADGVVTEAQVAKVSAFTAKELTEGEALLKSEIEFRFKKEALEEVARLKAEAEQLKSREERQREVNEKLAALEASLGADVVAAVE